MKRLNEPDDFDVFGLHGARLQMNRMRVLLAQVRSANEATPVKKMDLTRPSLIGDEYLCSCFSLKGLEELLAPLLLDVTPILKLPPLSRRTRLVLFYCHFLPYLVLAVFPLILATQLIFEI